AMCNKVLRNAPARQTTYLKLAKLYASKGFLAEAKQNFVEYAERMKKIGKIDHAFAALKEFTDISAESGSLREMLAEHLKMYGTDPGKRGSSARISTPKPLPPPGGDDLGKSGKRKTSSLVFLDLDEPPVSKAPKAPASPPPPPVAEKLIQEVVPEPDESLEIESTSLVDEGPGRGVGGGMLEGLETTGSDFGQMSASSPAAPSIREELNPSDLDLGPMAELEPTAPEVTADEVSGLEDADLVLEGNIEAPAPPAKKPAPPKQKPLGQPAGKAAAPEPPRAKPALPKRPPARGAGDRGAGVARRRQPGRSRSTSGARRGADRTGRSGTRHRGARPRHWRLRERRQPRARARSGGRSAAARPEQRASPPESGGIRIQGGRQSEIDRRLSRAGRRVVALRPPREGARGVCACRGARSQERSRQRRAVDARPRRRAAIGEAGGQGQGERRQDESPGRGRAGRRFRRPRLDAQRRRRRAAGERHAHDRCGRGADGRRGAGFPGH